MANGYIHMGTMAGKLKGVMPAQTPMGWRMVLQSMPASHVVERIAHHQARHAAGHFHHLDHAADFGPGVVPGLPVLARQDGREFIGVLVEQRFEAVQHLHAIDHRDVAPFQERGVGSLNGAVHIGGRGIRHLGDPRPRGGVGYGFERSTARRLPNAVDVERNGFGRDHLSPPIAVRWQAPTSRRLHARCVSDTGRGRVCPETGRRPQSLRRARSRSARCRAPQSLRTWNSRRACDASWR